MGWAGGRRWQGRLGRLGYYKARLMATPQKTYSEVDQY